MGWDGISTGLSLVGTGEVSVFLNDEDTRILLYMGDWRKCYFKTVRGRGVALGVFDRQESW